MLISAAKLLMEGYRKHYNKVINISAQIKTLVAVECVSAKLSWFKPQGILSLM